MNNFKQQIKQIEDTKELYHIVDNFYRNNNILYIRAKTKYGSFILYNKKFYIEKYFYEALPYIYNNDKYNKEWIKKYSQECKYYQTIYFFNQITNE